MIDFPASPTVGQNFSAAGVTWQWDGVKWSALAINTAWVPLAGGTMTGPLVLSQDPTAPLNPASKQYVDVRFAERIGRNRLINGAFAIDQWNNYGVVTIPTGSSIFGADRWRIAATQAGKLQSHVGLVGLNQVPASGMLNVSVAAAYTPLVTDNFSLYQYLEWGNIGDCQFGSAIAQPLVLSFWAIATNAGMYSGSICNSGGTRSYPFTFNLAASVWTYVTITIPPDTAGTWAQAYNAGAMYVRFDFGCGSNFRSTAGTWQAGNFIGVTGTATLVTQPGAGFNITNIQLEVGTVASPFDFRTIGRELEDCERYYQLTAASAQFTATASGQANMNSVNWTVMRAVPTVTFLSSSGGQAFVSSISLVPDTVAAGHFQLVASGAGSSYSLGNNYSLNSEL